MRRGAEQKEKGMAAIEFALLAPILLLIMFGIVEFGMAFYRKQLLTAAVREGARYGVIASSPRPTATQIKSKVSTYLTDAGMPDYVLGTPTACASNTSTLTVTAWYPTQFTVVSNLTKWFGSHESAVSSSKMLSASITMQCE